MRFWKKPVNVNFMTILMVVLLLIGLAVACGSVAMRTAGEVGAIGREFNSLRMQGGDGVTGWGALLTGFIGLTGAAVVILCWTVAIVLAVTAAFLFLPLLIARLVYRNTGGRLLAYRIIMGVEYVFLSLFVLLLLGMMAGTVMSVIILLPLVLIIIAIIAVNMVNTYSDRIKA